MIAVRCSCYGLLRRMIVGMLHHPPYLVSFYGWLMKDRLHLYLNQSWLLHRRHLSICYSRISATKLVCPSTHSHLRKDHPLITEANFLPSLMASYCKVCCSTFLLKSAMASPTATMVVRSCAFQWLRFASFAIAVRMRNWSILSLPRTVCMNWISLNSIVDS